MVDELVKRKIPVITPAGGLGVVSRRRRRRRLQGVHRAGPAASLQRLL